MRNKKSRYLGHSYINFEHTLFFAPLILEHPRDIKVLINVLINLLDDMISKMILFLSSELVMVFFAQHFPKMITEGLMGA